ncbi:hypothetical protein ACTPD5_21260, partial [Clostridioides difficile]
VQDIVNIGRYPYTGFFGSLSKKDLIMVDEALESVDALHLKKRPLEEMKAAVDEAIKAGKITATHAQGRTGIKNAVLAGITSIEHG